MLRNLWKESRIQNFLCVLLSFPMNLLCTKFHLIIASNEWVIVHLIMFLFTSKPGSVTSASSFTKVLPKFDQTFQDHPHDNSGWRIFVTNYHDGGRKVSKSSLDRGRKQKRPLRQTAVDAWRGWSLEFSFYIFPLRQNNWEIISIWKA